MSSATTSGSADELGNRTQQPMLPSRQPTPPTAPTLAPPAGRFAQYFPLGYREAFNQWWATVSPAIAEHNVLSFVPHLRLPPTHTQTGITTSTSDEAPMTYHPDPARAAKPVLTDTLHDPFGPRSWRSMMVQLSGKNRALNEFSVEREGEDIEENLVMLHGYGAGLGFFYKNFEGISRVKGLKLYALDMLGMGRSTRTPFRVHAKDAPGKISEAESWFVDALEEWRILRKIDKFTLLGHSMGGYMAVAYSLKYPGHLNKLILASPVGIPEDPYATQADMPEQSTMENEVWQDQEEDIVNKQPSNGNNNNNNNNAMANTRLNAAPRRPIPKWVTYLWDANISPFSIVRWTGPLGPRFVSGWTSRRFSHLPEEEAQALHEYAYSLFRQRGSGEYALAYILAPGAFARSPLIRRIAGVGRQPLVPANSPGSKPNAAKVEKETGIPVVMMYGENDWMDVAGGFAAEQKLNEAKAEALKSASVEERQAENGSAKVVVIQRAGHHLYLDGWEEFNEVIRNEMEETTEELRRRKKEESGNGTGTGTN